MDKRPVSNSNQKEKSVNRSSSAGSPAATSPPASSLSTTPSSPAPSTSAHFPASLLLVPVDRPPSVNIPNVMVKLNIGGVKYVTTSATLISKGHNFFTALLTNTIPSMKDEEGYYFIDRNGRYFEPLLDFFRTGELWIPEGMRKEAVLAEADFFLIEPLRELNRISGTKKQPKFPGAGQGHKLKYIYQCSQGDDPVVMTADDDTFRRIFAPAYPLLKFAAKLGFPGFAVEIRSESDTGIQAYYDIFGSKAMPSGLIKLDIAPSSDLAKELYTEKGRMALEEYLRREGFERVSSHYDTNRGSIVVSIGW